jgi:hypothetical protein
MGPAKVSGTLSSSGGLVQGHLRVEGSDGTRECSVAGPIASGRVTLASSDCTPTIRLAGRLSRDGRSISGTVTSTVTFDGRTVDAQDAWSMRASP